MTDNYDNGTNNKTETKIITIHRKPITENTREIISDLGTLIGEKNNSNSNSKLNLNLNLNKNTFRPCLGNENDSAPEARVSPKEERLASEPEKIVVGFGGVMAAQPKKSKFGFRRLSHNDHYTEINIQVGNVREEGRYMRCRVYVSLKDQYDKKYSIFLSGAATNSKKELIRGAKDNQQVIDVIETLKNLNPESMIARLHYKAVNGYQTDFHKKNLKSAILSIYQDNGILNARLYLLGEFIDIELNQSLTKKQQEYYVAAGIYRNELDQFNSDDEELE
jgi:hypothetical protein